VSLPFQSCMNGSNAIAPIPNAWLALPLNLSNHLKKTRYFLLTNRGFFAEALGDAVTQAKFAPHEYNESVLPAVAAEYEQSLRSPTHHALDLAHSLAFRSGLGSSLFADPHTAVDHATTIAFANATFGQASNIAVAATGVEESTLRSLVDEFFTTSTPAAASTSTLSPTQYFGGDLRIASVLHSASPSDTLLLAFQGASSASSANLSVLRHLLGGESSIKWSKGTSPLSLLSTSSHVSAQAFNLAYSDAGLFGVVLRAPTREMRALAEKTIAILNSLKSAGGIKEESLKQAIAKAKFEKASEVESKIARLESVGAQVNAFCSASFIWLTDVTSLHPTASFEWISTIARIRFR
jgi:ubiquinol-cytochrome c reductase core subunit 2